MAEMQINRVGKISSINYDNGTARVTYDDQDGNTTPEIPFLAWEYWMPKIGDQVLVTHRQNGAASAVILGPFWYDGNRPQTSGEGIYRKEYANVQGKAGETYNAKTDTFTITAGGCVLTMTGGKLTISAPSGVTIDTPTVTVTGDVVAAGVSLDNHTHPGCMGGKTGKPG
jgi:phage baseplate assembly protein gpV